MAKIKLVHFELVALLQDSKKLMDYLQKIGITEIEKTENEDVTHLDTDGIVRQLEGFYHTADSAKALILRLAAEQYAALGDEEYETSRLRRLFSAFECVAELNADLLKSTVSEVLVTRQNVKLRLKNGQVIERSDLQ